MKTLVTFVVGFGAGWAVRSLADSPHGVGVKLMSVACRTKDQIDRWLNVERERLADILAEARAKTQSEAASERSNSFKKAA